MNNTKYLYLMTSQTDTCVGSIIRTLSGYRYNHVSVTLDASLRSWVSFGRFTHDAPLYAGFISESIERYLAKGKNTPVHIYKLEISEEKYRQLEMLFTYTDRHDTDLIYNSLDAFAAVIRKKVSIRGAYTCLSFACTILDMQYITIEALDHDLLPYRIYDGSLAALLPDSGRRTDRYFSNMGIWKGTCRTVIQLTELFIRLVSKKQIQDIILQQLQSAS